MTFKPVDTNDLACLLFVPGTRPERFAKAMAASPDGVVLDLEDAVSPGEKDVARGHVAQALAQLEDGERRPPLLVRINSVDTRAGLDDLAALADGAIDPDGLIIPKAEGERDIAILRAHDPRRRSILAAIETAAGLDSAAAIARALGPGDGLGFGGADLAADLRCDFAWEPLLAARSIIVRAAARARIAAFDVPHLEFRDLSALTEETRRSKALGFTGKLAIHPAQVAPIRAVYCPDPQAVALARRIIEAMEAGGVVAVDGKMIDAPVATAARLTLARATRFANATSTPISNGE